MECMEGEAEVPAAGADLGDTKYKLGGAAEGKSPRQVDHLWAALRSSRRVRGRAVGACTGGEDVSWGVLYLRVYAARPISCTADCCFPSCCGERTPLEGSSWGGSGSDSSARDWGVGGDSCRGQKIDCGGKVLVLRVELLWICRIRLVRTLV